MPNIYTGYIMLLDDQNRVRWMGSGEASKEEIDMLIGVIDALSNEEDLAA